MAVRTTPATRTTTRARTTTRTMAPAHEELPDRTRWALDAQAALLLDRRIAVGNLATIDTHIAEAELNVKAAAASDGVTGQRLTRAKAAMSAATGVDVMGPTTTTRPRRTTTRKRSPTGTGRRAAKTKTGGG